MNLGNLYGRGRAAEQSPVFSQSTRIEPTLQEQEMFHVAIVKLADVGSLQDEVLDGIAETLSQLNRLSISPCIFIQQDLDAPREARARQGQQIDKLAIALAEKGKRAAWRVDNIFSTTRDGAVRVQNRELLLRPLRRGQIPLVTTIAYSTDDYTLVTIDTDTAILALVKEFADLDRSSLSVQMQKEMSIDRLITVDAAGGLPKKNEDGDRHVFLNLEQEYESINEQLALEDGNVRSKLRKANLDLMQDALRILPSSSSGLMTTFTEVANLKTSEQSVMSGVGTRRQKNTLIHNLLTDKPAHSSSLPSSRRNQNDATTISTSISSFVKRGMPLTILPDPASEPWRADAPRLKLTDPRIDLARLVHLIEDSFGRKLDVEEYLDRVNHRIAGVIVAGDYEGGAILTWEDPGMSDSNSQLVPYLDKFAVLRRSQGAGGVADIVFNAMVRICFPHGVCWRSRKDNPVNKWYFERSRGTWKIPSTNWTMFWTTPGVELADNTFKGYESVCRAIEPSWADTKRPAD